jgi:NAD+ synthase (glutamine-hydrolysing)
VKIALAQINPTVGDFSGNLEKIVAASRRAAAKGARLTVFSELAICGYPPADFLEKPSFLARCRTAVDELAAATASFHRRACGRGSAGGAGERQAGRQRGRSAGRRASAAGAAQAPVAVLRRLRRAALFFARAATAGGGLDGVRLAITICEDAWNDKNFWPRRLYSVDPMEELMRQHPALHINLSSSPFWHGKRAIRREMLAAIARRDGVPVLMCNQVGGNDSLIFDGSSLAIECAAS